MKLVCAGCGAEDPYSIEEQRWIIQDHDCPETAINKVASWPEVPEAAP